MLAFAVAATVKIGVFGLFQPTQLELRPVSGYALEVHDYGQKRTALRGDVIQLKSGVRATGRNGAMTVFLLSVPGKIHREFYGRLEIKRLGNRLVPVLETDRERAVAASASAEMNHVPLEAMKAQVVATRSYMVALKAKHAHEGFDFCDTTHCQYFKGRLETGNEAPRAANLTRELAVIHEGKVLATLYSSNCGGETNLPEDVGWTNGNYSFFRVACPVKTEAKGHGVGMCQRGAIELARQGAGFREILAHFFPATSIEALAYVRQ